MQIKTHLTLEQLEKEYWGEPQFYSNLVITCHELRKKPLRDFEPKDLRIMIGQSFSLEYLMPLSLIELGKNILVEADLYEGDLLIISLEKENKNYWKENQDLWTSLVKLIERNEYLIEDRMLEEIKNKMSYIES